jgi:hypothetical protein
MAKDKSSEMFFFTSPIVFTFVLWKKSNAEESSILNFHNASRSRSTGLFPMNGP